MHGDDGLFHGKAPGYLRCMEDGRTGWGVVLSLTQALQHELGISPTVQNFGPGTFAKVASTIKPDLTQQTNTNILRIYNYALWCKGYYGSANAGTWDLRAKLSIGELLGDMGLPDTQNPIEARMWAHVTKALLRMDQFRLIPGGDGVIRGFQQTLNRDYVRLGVVPAMGLSPCDGNYDRVTQQCLMMAIQYRLGLNPADITGYFGDGTTRELKKHTLTTGSAASELTYLLHAACYFNSPAYKGAPYGSGGETFDFPWDTIRLVDNGRKFTADTAAWLRHYQEFMLLATSGNATFDTWAQLLISRGDQHRAATGSDTSVTITPERARALVAKGYKVVGRYLDEHLPPDDPDYIGKALVPGEPKTIIDAGLRLMPIFQYNGTVPGNFTYQKGYDQAGKAHDKMVEHHMLQGAYLPLDMRVPPQIEDPYALSKQVDEATAAM
ncbi:glycoside hydrolase domain-containing protein, partial [Nonomuraea sp. NPDC055795]